ncbi:hypothetical protein PR048_014817 [Dryococelus australis]|uniref:Uncharacterized protein n=1 Tax=Dryococelus australis TaxID=614101 RepID=A0ABQ9HF83_9NEOP|nr:hypothetical protein PR048_014817 [Dryococelus australis]
MKASMTRKSYKHLEAPIVSRNASPITSPACKIVDGSEMPSAEAEKLQPKDLQTSTICLSNISSQEHTPDVEAAEAFPCATELPSNTEKADSITELSEVAEAAQDTGDNTSKEHRHGRRRSSAWKAFSLKKQFSRVDQKLKHTFSVDSKHVINGKQSTSVKEKHYSSVDQNSVDCVNSPAVLSPVNDITPDLLSSMETVPFDFVNRDTTDDLEAGKETCDNSLQSSFKEVETPDVVVETPPLSSAVSPVDELGGSSSDAEVLKSIEEQIVEVNEVSVKESDVGDGKRPSRPVDLPLFDVDGKPIRPPRRDCRKKCSVVLERAAEKRDARLLSVPNIKYQQQKGDQHLVHDLRRKEDTSPASFSNLMRRLSKFHYVVT